MSTSSRRPFCPQALPRCPQALASRPQALASRPQALASPFCKSLLCKGLRATRNFHTIRLIL